MNLADLYNRETEVSTEIRTKLLLEDLFVIIGEYKKYARYKYKVSIAATFTTSEDVITCKFWADMVYCKKQNIDPRIYQDNFIRISGLLIAGFEDVISTLADDDDVISSQSKDIRKPTIKKAMRKYIPELKVLDARKARKKARKTRKELARAKDAAQQNAWSLD